MATRQIQSSNRRNHSKDLEVKLADHDENIESYF